MTCSAATGSKSVGFRAAWSSLDRKRAFPRRSTEPLQTSWRCTQMAAAITEKPGSLPALQLRSVNWIPVEVPLRYVLGTSAATVRAAPLLLVEVLTEQGVVGRSYVFCYRRSGAKSIALLLADAAELVRGDSVAPLTIAAKLQRRFDLIGVTG